MKIDFGSTDEVQILLATRAKEWQSSLDAPLKDVHSLLHPCASIPDGPADPVVCMAAERMTLVLIDSKMTGCVSWGGTLEYTTDVGALACWIFADQHISDR